MDCNLVASNVFREELLIFLHLCEIQCFDHFHVRLEFLNPGKEFCRHKPVTTLSTLLSAQLPAFETSTLLTLLGETTKRCGGLCMPV